MARHDAARAPAPGPRPISCSASLSLAAPISCGWPMSPTSRPRAGTLYLAVVLDVWSRRSVGGPWRPICGRRWCWRPGRGHRAAAAGRRRSSLGPGLPIRGHRLGPAVSRHGIRGRWARSAVVTTVRCARASLPRSSVSCSIASPGLRLRPPAGALYLDRRLVQLAPSPLGARLRGTDHLRTSRRPGDGWREPVTRRRRRKRQPVDRPAEAHRPPRFDMGLRPAACRHDKAGRTCRRALQPRISHSDFDFRLAAAGRRLGYGVRRRPLRPCSKIV